MGNMITLLGLIVRSESHQSRCANGDMLAHDIFKLHAVAQAADDLMGTLGAEGEIDTRHPKTRILLDALYAWRPQYAEGSNVKLTGSALLRSPG